MPSSLARKETRRRRSFPLVPYVRGAVASESGSPVVSSRESGEANPIGIIILRGGCFEVVGVCFASRADFREARDELQKLYLTTNNNASNAGY
jgi:hypothetical protein